MKRLIEGMGDNSAKGYDEIYAKRKELGTDAQDYRRWKKLLQHYRGGKLIDLGCLDSMIPMMAKAWYPKAEVWGIDIAEEAIKDMQRQNPDALFQVGDVYDTLLPSNYFDYAVAGELIEHLDDPEKFLSETFRILKHGGILALSTPLGETHAGEVDNHRHLWSWEVEDMYTLMAPYGSVRTKVVGSQYFPTYTYHFPTIISFTKKK